jgi:hypothetical protein
MAPTAFMDSGQRSRSSKTQGFLFILERKQAEIAVKNWGEVAIIKSVFMNNPATEELKAKLK